MEPIEFDSGLASTGTLKCVNVSSLEVSEAKYLESILCQSSCLVKDHDINSSADVDTRWGNAEYALLSESPKRETRPYSHRCRQGWWDRDGNEVTSLLHYFIILKPKVYQLLNRDSPTNNCQSQEDSDVQERVSIE